MYNNSSPSVVGHSSVQCWLRKLLYMNRKLCGSSETRYHTTRFSYGQVAPLLWQGWRESISFVLKLIWTERDWTQKKRFLSQWWNRMLKQNTFFRFNDAPLLQNKKKISGLIISILIWNNRYWLKTDGQEMIKNNCWQLIRRIPPYWGIGFDVDYLNL
jgi:hypothetical protein